MRVYLNVAMGRQLSVVPNLYQAGFFIRFMGNIRCHLRWLLEYDGNLSSEMLKGSALPSPKRLRAGRCKGFPPHPTDFYNFFFATVR